MSVEKRQLAFDCIDYWNRPTFVDANGNRFGNMDILFDGKASFEEVNKLVTEKDIYYFGRNIDDDPMGTKIDATKIILVKELTQEL